MKFCKDNVYEVSSGGNRYQCQFKKLLGKNIILNDYFLFGSYNELLMQDNMLFALDLKS